MNVGLAALALATGAVALRLQKRLWPSRDEPRGWYAHLGAVRARRAAASLALVLASMLAASFLAPPAEARVYVLGLGLATVALAGHFAAGTWRAPSWTAPALALACLALFLRLAELIPWTDRSLGGTLGAAALLLVAMGLVALFIDAWRERTARWQIGLIVLADVALLFAATNSWTELGMLVVGILVLTSPLWGAVLVLALASAE